MATSPVRAVTIGDVEVGNAQAQVPPQLVFPAIHPVECDRLQQDADLLEGQQDIARANRGCSGAPYDAQNAVSAKTAKMTRPLKRHHHTPPRPVVSSAPAEPCPAAGRLPVLRSLKPRKTRMTLMTATPSEMRSRPEVSLDTHPPRSRFPETVNPDVR
jgi:hypothetical protein